MFPIECSVSAVGKELSSKKVPALGKYFCSKQKLNKINPCMQNRYNTPAWLVASLDARDEPEPQSSNLDFGLSPSLTSSANAKSQPLRYHAPDSSLIHSCTNGSSHTPWEVRQCLQCHPPRRHQQSGQLSVSDS